mgnify:CR=1 FL=1
MPLASPRASARGFPAVPLQWNGPTEEWIRLGAEAVRNLQDGKINATGTVTLTANAATTTLTDRRIGPDSVILFMPTTENAATAMGNLRVTSRGDGTATLTHTNNAQTDRTFAYAILG